MSTVDDLRSAGSRGVRPSAPDADLRAANHLPTETRLTPLGWLVLALALMLLFTGGFHLVGLLSGWTL